MRGGLRPKERQRRLPANAGAEGQNNPEFVLKLLESHFKGRKHMRLFRARMRATYMIQGVGHSGRERSERQMRRDYVTFISLFDAALKARLP